MWGDSVNSDFPRIITLLRKERNISQKNAASDLGVSQALLSHYEKGIRECGLDFLVRAADYYNVSCDYLLGRSPEPTGTTISYSDIPEHDPNQKENIRNGSMMASFNKKLIINSLNILFPLVSKTGSNTLMREVSSFIMLAIYKMFRITYTANPKNDQLFFTVPEIIAANGASSAMSIAEANAAAAAKGVKIYDNDTAVQEESPLITSSTLSEEYPNYTSSLLNLVKNSEARIQLISHSDK